MAAPFYRRTKIHDLEEKHPGLLEFVKARQRRRVPNPQIAAAILEQWGETVSEQVLSNFYTLVVWPEENERADSIRRANEQAAMILKIAAESPDLDEAKMAKVLLTQAIIENSADLAESDPLKLFAEQRKRIELEQHQQEIEIERERVKQENKRLELEIEKLKAEREREKTMVKAAVASAEGGEAKSKDELLKRVDEIYGVYQEADPAALPGGMRSGSGEAAGGPVVPSGG